MGSLQNAKLLAFRGTVKVGIFELDGYAAGVLVCLKDAGESAPRSCPAVWLAGLPGEAFVAYGRKLARRLRKCRGAASERVFVASCVNDAVGYLGTARDIRAGGYEVEEAYKLYGRPAPYAPAVERVLLDAVSAGAVVVCGRQACWRRGLGAFAPLREPGSR